MSVCRQGDSRGLAHLPKVNSRALQVQNWNSGLLALGFGSAFWIQDLFGSSNPALDDIAKVTQLITQWQSHWCSLFHGGPGSQLPKWAQDSSGQNQQDK